MHFSKITKYLSIAYYFLVRCLFKLHVLRDFGFFTDYFKVKYQIAHEVTVQLYGRTIPVGQLRHLQIRLYQLAIFISAVISVIRFFFQDSFPDLVNVVQYNYFFLEGYSSGFHIWVAAFGCIAIYFYELMYFENDGLSALWMSKILVDGINYHFIWPYVQTIKVIYKKRRKYRLFAPRNIVEYFREKAVWVRNWFQVTYICNVAYFMVAEWNIYGLFQQCGAFNYLFGFFVYLCFQFFCICTHILAALGLHALITTATFGILIMCFSFVCLYQNGRFVNSCPPAQFSNRRLMQFLQLSAFSIRVLHDVNRIYGKSLFVFILVGMPTNAMMLMVLLTQPLSLFKKFILLTLVIFEMLFLFVVHFFSAHITLKLHRPAKSLIAVLMVGKKIGSLEHKLKLMRYIETFHTKNPYTVSYGKFGSVTFESFGKHLFYYFKIISLVINSLYLMKR